MTRGGGLDWTEKGSGDRVLLLVHGFPLSREIWEEQVEALSHDLQVIAPDLRGFGASPGRIESMEAAARDLLELMDQLGCRKFAAAGHSMGGYVLFAMRRLAPDRLSALGLVCTRAAADSEETKKSREEMARRAMELGVEFLADLMPRRQLAPGTAPELVEKVRRIVRRAAPEGVAAALRAMAARTDATPLLSTLDLPVVVIAGRRDPLIPAAETEAMAAAIPSARLVWCENAAHLAMMEEPRLVTDALRLLAVR